MLEVLLPVGVLGRGILNTSSERKNEKVIRKMWELCVPQKQHLCMEGGELESKR